MQFVTKRGFNFQPSILKRWKGQKYFYGHFRSSLVLLTTKLSCLQKNTFGNTKMLICKLKRPSLTYEIISQYFRTKKGTMIYGQKFGRSGHSAWRHLGMQQRLIPKTFSLISVQMHKVIWRSSRSKKVPNNQYSQREDIV